MGLKDFEVFLQERIMAWDESADIAPGSPLDAQVIQPVLRRIGTDPYTMDAAAFIYDRLQQEHPEVAIGAGDATTDILVKMMLLLWDPIIRETKRVAAMQSFRDPFILNTTEAEALGANLFSERAKGAYATGVGRLYFAQPQSVAITQSNFFSTRNGLRFFPRQIQSIRREEMALNSEGESYYFDVGLIAEAPGDQYNIGVGELSTIANIPGSIRVTNKTRFKNGLPAQDAVDFIAHIARDITERSLVTLRGITAKLAAALPEITTLQVIGFGDPEMQRDVISGGNWGPILAGGVDAQAAPDGEFRALTRRIRVPGANLCSVLGAVGAVSGFGMNLINAFVGGPIIRDVGIVRLVDPETVELAEQMVVNSATNIPWSIRRKQLTLSGIPGGILFPDSPDGTVSIESDKIHVGGCTDTYTRAGSFDSGNITIDVATDEQPLLYGLQARPDGTLPINGFLLLDFKCGPAGNYTKNSETYRLFELAARRQYTLRVFEGNNAGNYRILKINQQIGGVEVIVSPTPPGLSVADTARWAILDVLEMDLVEPKDTRISGDDGSTIQNLNLFMTGSSVDFDVLGVSVGDTLRISGTGADAGDFTVTGLVSPHTTLTVDRPFQFSRTGLRYTIFRANSTPGVSRPLLRIKEIEILDTSGQPTGSTIPYAKPVGAISQAFSNYGRGVRVELREAVLGLVSTKGPFVFSPGGGALAISWDAPSGTIVCKAHLSGAMTAADVVDAINASPVLPYPIAKVLQYNGNSYVGIMAPGSNTQINQGASTLAIVQVLFGAAYPVGSLPRASHVRAFHDPCSPDNPVQDWTIHKLDQKLDAAHVVSGFQVGFYGVLPTLQSKTPWVLELGEQFSPEIGVVLRVGSRSVGVARTYFLEPTSFEVGPDTVFTTENEEGVLLRFFPDPLMEHQIFPVLPNGRSAKDGETISVSPPSINGVLASASQDFFALGVQPGDSVQITFSDLWGNVALPDPIPGLGGKILSISVNNTQNKTVTFLGTTAGDSSVSRDEVAAQINVWLGQEVCKIQETFSGSGDFRLVFDADVRIVVRLGGLTHGNSLLGFSTSDDTTNDAASAGTYCVKDVDVLGHSLTITTPIATLRNETNQRFRITRSGVQRICSTAMSENVGMAGLYYVDVELLSEGTGDFWNIPSGAMMRVDGYQSDGYYLSTKNPNLTFSPAEDVTLHISRSIIDVGADDDPSNATQISGQMLNINYDYSAIVRSNQAFQMSDSERVINQSPLARHLIPHLVRFEVQYVGGSKGDVALPLVEKYVNQLAPFEALESSDIQKILMGNGAHSVTNPIDLLAVVYDINRDIYINVSQNALTTGRLAAFVPDRITLIRRTT